MMETEEARLVAALQQGDAAAFTQMVKAHHDGLVRLARAMLNNGAAADEVVQEGWIRALKGIDGFQGRSSLRTWLFTIVANLARTHMRKAGRAPTIPLETTGEYPEASEFAPDGHWRRGPIPWHDENPEALLAQRELAGRLGQVLSSLPPQQRAVCTLHDLEGVPMVEICNILAVSESNGRVLLHRARKRLHKAIADHNAQ